MPAPRIIFSRALEYLTRHSWQRILVVGAYGLVLVQVLILAANNFTADRPVLGLRYEHRPLLFTSPSKLQDIINADVSRQETRAVTVSAGKYNVHVTARQLGVSYSASTIYRQALTLGRSGSWLQRLWQQDKAFLGQTDLILNYSGAEKAAVARFLSFVAARADQPATDASFELKNGNLLSQPGVAGHHLDPVRSLDAVLRIQPGDGPVKLAMVTDAPKITPQDLKPLRPAVEDIVSKPLQLLAAGKSLTVSPERLLGMVRPVRVPDPAKPARTIVKLDLQDAAISQPLDEVAAEASINAKPRIVAGRKIVQSGHVGIHIDGVHAKIALASEIASRQLMHRIHTEVTVPSEVVDAPVVDQFAGEFPAYVGSAPAVTLTFDDGPNGTFTEPILDILKRYQAHAIFFLVGQNVNAFPQVTQRIVAEGHTLGNHSFTHAQLTHLSVAGAAAELDQTQHAIDLSVHFLPKLFRPPYGDVNETIRNLAADRGMHTMMWSVDPRDWAQPGPAVIADRIVSAAEPGSNILLHVLHQQTVDALPAIIEGLKNRGFAIN